MRATAGRCGRVGSVVDAAESCPRTVPARRSTRARRTAGPAVRSGGNRIRRRDLLAQGRPARIPAAQVAARRFQCPCRNRPARNERRGRARRDPRVPRRLPAQPRVLRAHRARKGTAIAQYRSGPQATDRNLARTPQGRARLRLGAPGARRYRCGRGAFAARLDAPLVGASFRGDHPLPCVESRASRLKPVPTRRELDVVGASFSCDAPALPRMERRASRLKPVPAAVTATVTCNGVATRTQPSLLSTRLVGRLNQVTSAPFSRAWRLTSAILARSTSWCERREAWLLPVLAHADNRRQPIAATDAYPIERFITTSSRMRGTATGRLPASRCHNPPAR